MDVKLKRTWFAPNGHRFRKGVNVIPDDLKKFLPSDATTLDGKKIDRKAKEDAKALEEQQKAEEDAAAAKEAERLREEAARKLAAEAETAEKKKSKDEADSADAKKQGSLKL